MIVLDTNVISELMKSKPDQAVVDWLDRQNPDDVWTSTISLFEIRFGTSIMPEGKRRPALTESFEAMLRDDLSGRVLDLNSSSSEAAATIAAPLRAGGNPVDFRDVFISGIVRSNGATLATRNARHFVQTGITLVDPWTQ